jgi:hypothetical protein
MKKLGADYIGGDLLLFGVDSSVFQVTTQKYSSVFQVTTQKYEYND